MRQVFMDQLDNSGIKLTIEQQANYYNDFKLYCKEMEFTTENEIIEGALEYITCQIHYGVF